MGGNTSYSSNGDHFHVATNPTLFVLDALGLALDTASDDLLAALAQMDPLAAEGEWADLWGAYFGVARRDGEDDADYTARIFVEVIRPRQNRYALENTLTEAVGQSVSVWEPWRTVLHASGYAPALSRHRLRDKRFWTHGTIAVEGADRNALRPFMDAHRAGGVWPTYWVRLAGTEAVNAPTVATHYTDMPQPTGMGGAELDWLTGPVGAVDMLGNEAWTWRTVAGRYAHVSPHAGTREHHHGAAGLPALAPGWMSLAVSVYLDADNAPSTILVGFRFGGAWRYVYWGADNCVETPRTYAGPVPASGYWVTLAVSASMLNMDTPAAIDGAFFGFYGGGGAFGPVVAQLVGDESEPAYRIGGALAVDLYTTAGVYVFALGLSEESAYPLYGLGPYGSGTLAHTIRAGESWPLGSLIEQQYRAGHATVGLSLAAWESGLSAIYADVQQVS